eukprot:99200-Hanusia_phi.AAC.1
MEWLKGLEEGEEEQEEQEEQEEGGRGIGEGNCDVSIREATDGNYFQGRVINVLPARQRKKEEEEQNREGGSKEGSSYKAKKKEQQKKTSSSSHNWNMLFMRSDTVAEAIANKHQMDKVSPRSWTSSSCLLPRSHLSRFTSSRRSSCPAQAQPRCPDLTSLEGSTP